MAGRGKGISLIKRLAEKGRARGDVTNPGNVNVPGGKAAKAGKTHGKKS